MNTLIHKNDTGAMPCSTNLSNNHGAVLVIVLLMLLLLTILGTTVLTNSTTEVRVAGNFRNQQQAFFVAQGALEHAPISSTVVSAMSNVDDCWAGTITFNGINVVVAPSAIYTASGNTNCTNDPVPPAENRAQARAEFGGSATPPRGSGASADLFVANYYEFDIVGAGPNNSEVEIISEVYRLQAKGN